MVRDRWYRHPVGNLFAHAHRYVEIPYAIGAFSADGLHHVVVHQEYHYLDLVSATFGVPEFGKTVLRHAVGYVNPWALCVSFEIFLSHITGSLNVVYIMFSSYVFLGLFYLGFQLVILVLPILGLVFTIRVSYLAQDALALFAVLGVQFTEFFIAFVSQVLEFILVVSVERGELPM